MSRPPHKSAFFGRGMCPKELRSAYWWHACTWRADAKPYQAVDRVAGVGRIWIEQVTGETCQPSRQKESMLRRGLRLGGDARCRSAAYPQTEGTNCFLTLSPLKLLQGAARPRCPRSPLLFCATNGLHWDRVLACYPITPTANLAASCCARNPSDRPRYAQPALAGSNLPSVTARTECRAGACAPPRA